MTVFARNTSKKMNKFGPQESNEQNDYKLEHEIVWWYQKKGRCALLSNQDSLILVMNEEEATLLSKQVAEAISEMAHMYTPKGMNSLLELQTQLRDFLRHGN